MNLYKVQPNFVTRCFKLRLIVTAVTSDMQAFAPLILDEIMIVLHFTKKPKYVKWDDLQGFTSRPKLQSAQVYELNI